MGPHLRKDVIGLLPIYSVVAHSLPRERPNVVGSTCTPNSPQACTLVQEFITLEETDVLTDYNSWKLFLLLQSQQVHGKSSLQT